MGTCKFEAGAIYRAATIGEATEGLKLIGELRQIPCERIGYPELELGAEKPAELLGAQARGEFRRDKALRHGLIARNCR